MLETVRQRAALFGDDHGRDVAVGVVAVHALWLMAMGPGIENPSWAQLLAFVSALVATALLGYNAGKLDPEKRFRWLKLLAAWAVFVLFTTAALTVAIYGSVESVSLTGAFGYRILALIWAAAAVSLLAVLAAHLGYVILAALGGRRSSEEIHEAVLEDEK